MDGWVYSINNCVYVRTYVHTYAGMHVCVNIACMHVLAYVYVTCTDTYT